LRERDDVSDAPAANIHTVDAAHFPVHVPVVVIGGGACGLVAALAARDGGCEVLVLERDAALGGSTALSSGFVPAAGTRVQRARGIVDSAELFAADILRKNHDESDPALTHSVAAAAGSTIDWLIEQHDLAFIVLDSFLYPGHSAHRMHAVPEQTGAALLARLERAAIAAGVDIITAAHVTALIARPDGRVLGVHYRRPDGQIEAVGCDALVLACSGFGGNRPMVREYIPEIADALFFGHTGNQGDAIAWGRGLGAAVGDMTAYQGHGSVATPHGVLITWALMMEGGFQVNARGARFSNEHQGYSEQAVSVIAQPDGVAWNIYDARLHALGVTFEDYRQAVDAGAVRSAATIEALAERLGLPVEALASTLVATRRFALGAEIDAFGRDFTGKPPLAAPFYAIKVTGALFHTQGGLAVDAQARVLRPDGTPLPNLCAGGGAARGLSGAHVAGYLSGNGLLAAVTLGRLAGASAAAIADGRATDAARDREADR
jgi:fumarate reductase flavoprotein subunit